MRLPCPALASIIALAACSNVTVPLGVSFVANGTAIKTSTGNMVEHYAGITYATRTGPFELSSPVQYADNEQEAETIVNPVSNRAIAPDQSTGELSASTASLLGIPLPPADETSCLQLDIYRPAQTNQAKLHRVMIYVHGGFMDARSTVQYRYDEVLRSLPSDSFSDSTIFVAVEFSLGPYGWWHEPEDTRAEAANDLQAEFGRFPANGAIHQVIQALLWVQRHIHYFGGDANDVTLAGHSSGGSIANWVHLGLSQRVLGIYGFAHYPFAKLLLMGGTASLFPSDTVHRVLKKQDDIAETLACGNIQPGSGRMECLQKIPAEELRKACLATNAAWHPTIDGLVVYGLLPDVLERRMLASLAWSTIPRVLFTVTDFESSVFCKRVNHVTRSIGRLSWLRLGQGEERAREIATLRDDLLDPNGLAWMTLSTSEAIFVFPAKRIHAAYQAAGMVSQSVQISIDPSFDVHAFVVGFLDALCRKVYGLPFWAVREMTHAGATVQAVKDGAVSLLRRASSAAQSLARMSSASLAHASCCTSAATQVLPMDGTLATLHSRQRSRNSHVDELDQPMDTLTERKMKNSAKWLYDVEHLTAKRLKKLTSAKTVCKLCRIVQRQLSTLGFFHGLDQMVLLNASYSVRGVPLRMDMLIPAAQSAPFVHAVRTFITGGTALGAGGAPLPSVTIYFGDTFSDVDTIAFVEGYRGIETDPLLSDGALLARLFDDLDVRPTPRPDGHSVLSSLISVMGLHVPRSTNVVSSARARNDPRAMEETRGEHRADRENINLSDYEDDNAVHSYDSGYPLEAHADSRPQTRGSVRLHRRPAHDQDDSDSLGSDDLSLIDA